MPSRLGLAHRHLTIAGITGVEGGVGIDTVAIGVNAGDTTHPGVSLQSGDALSLLGDDGVLAGHFHLAQFVQYLLGVGGVGHLDCGGVVSHVKLNAVNATLGSAAAICNLSGQVIGVLGVLITKLANGIAQNLIVVVHGSQNVVGLALQRGEVEPRGKVLGGGDVAAVAAEAKAVTAAQQREEQDPHDPAAASHVAEPVATVYGGANVRKRVIFHHEKLLFFYL